MDVFQGIIARNGCNLSQMERKMGPEVLYCCWVLLSSPGVKTPSKMDVAPWDKHWIKRELDSFGLYSMVFVEIQSYSMVFVEIQWYSMVFVDIQWYSMDS